MAAFPSISVTANAGTGASATVTGVDVAGVISFTTGTGVSSGDQFTVSFGGEFSSSLWTFAVYPVNVAAQGQKNQLSWDFSGPLVATNSGASLADNTNYQWAYKVL